MERLSSDFKQFFLVKNNFLYFKEQMWLPNRKCYEKNKLFWPGRNAQNSIRPIVSSRDSMTYRVSKILVGIIYPLVGQSPHHLKIHNTVDYIKQVRQEPEEVITSYDVKALFTSVPVDPSIQIVQQTIPVDPSIQIVQIKLSQDTTLPQRTSMFIQQIIKLLEFCLKNPYFLSKVSIMNRYMVQPLVSQLAPSMQPAHGSDWSQSP